MASNSRAKFVTRSARILCVLLPTLTPALVVGCGDDSEDGPSTSGGASGKGSGGAGTGGAKPSGGNNNAAGEDGSAGETQGGAGGVPEAAAGAGGETELVGGAGGEDAGGAGGFGGEAVGGEGGEGGSEEPAPPPLNCVPDTANPAKVLPLAPGHDSLYGAVFDADGNIFATGNVSDGTANDSNRSTVLVKIKPNGTLDTSFSTDGIATVDVVTAGGGELPRGIVLQSDGKIVLAGTVEHDAAATGVFASDRDVYVVRFNTDGTLDTTFGTGGKVILNLNDGIEGTNNQGNPTLLAPDAQWGLSVYPGGDDKLLVYSAQRATGNKAGTTDPRTDTDWALVRLTKDGAVDTTFGVDGKFTYDIGEAGASARTTTLLPDGTIVAAGYSTYSGTQRPVVIKIAADGKSVLWVFSEPVATAAEAYGAALQSNGKLVTVGYGRPNAAATSTDFVSLRLNSFGTLDTTYGTNGTFWLDVGGYGDNGRNMTVLGDDRVVLVGGGRVSETNLDGVVTILTKDGAPLTSWAPKGCKTYDFGSPGDFLWGAALSQDKSTLAFVGTQGVAQGSTEDNDSAVVILPVP